MSVYLNEIPEYGVKITVEEFKRLCDGGEFIDYDGHGCASDGNLMSDVVISPSTRHKTPDDATHIIWFNR